MPTGFIRNIGFFGNNASGGSPVATFIVPVRSFLVGITVEGIFDVTADGAAYYGLVGFSDTPPQASAIPSGEQSNAIVIFRGALHTLTQGAWLCDLRRHWQLPGLQLDVGQRLFVHAVTSTGNLQGFIFFQFVNR